VAERSSGQDDYRYERKFVTLDLDRHEIEAILRLHPACFSEAHHQRYVNNIYLDTASMECFHANVEGLADRMKCRVRWYGGLQGAIGRPTLEFKQKRGLLGKKATYPVPPFRLDESFDATSFMEGILKHDLPDLVREQISMLEPTLLNRYRRRYFISADDRFRVTVDTELSFYRIHRTGNRFVEQSVPNPTVVLELKYHREEQPLADSISNGFPFRLSRSSKYVQGLERLLPW
jgi:SPX domain protein involved in polyphosphate accumulation